MTGINGHHSPALPLDEVRRFVDATRPIFASAKMKPQDSGFPARTEKPIDVDIEGAVKVSGAVPSAVRSAEGIPFPTRGGPEGD